MKPGSELIAHAIRDLSKGLRRAPVKGREGPKIHRLAWTGGVLDCFRGCDRAPCRGWIPAPYRVRGRLFAGMTEVGDFGGQIRSS